jgi:hypothetical protein
LPGRTQFDAITLERGLTDDTAKHIKLENEGWERDTSVVKPVHP